MTREQAIDEAVRRCRSTGPWMFVAPGWTISPPPLCADTVGEIWRPLEPLTDDVIAEFRRIMERAA